MAQADEIERLRLIWDEWDDECRAECDSYGHEGDCPATVLLNALKDRRRRAEQAEARVKDLEARLMRERGEALTAAENEYEARVKELEAEVSEMHHAFDTQQVLIERERSKVARLIEALEEIAAKGHTTERHSYGAAWPICKCVRCYAGHALAEAKK